MKKILLVLLTLVISINVFPQAESYKDKNICSIKAEHFVKQKLSYPKEAKFNRKIVHETDGYGSATVLGKVNTKNAYGVKIEYVYKIWLTHNGKEWTDNNNWEMKKLIIEDSSTKQQYVFTE